MAPREASNGLWNEEQRKLRRRKGPKRTLGGATRPKDSTNLSTARGDVAGFFSFPARFAPVGGFRNARALASRSSPRFATVCCCREGMRGCVEGPEGGLWCSKKTQTEGRGEHDLDSFVIFPQAQRQTFAARFISRAFFVETVKIASSLTWSGRCLGADFGPQSAP